jgi:hypothetical protein
MTPLLIAVLFLVVGAGVWLLMSYRATKVPGILAASTWGWFSGVMPQLIQAVKQHEMIEWKSVKSHCVQFEMQQMLCSPFALKVAP